MRKAQPKQTGKERNKQAHTGQPLTQAIFSLRKKKDLGKRLAAASFFACEDHGMMARILHLGAFIKKCVW